MYALAEGDPFLVLDKTTQTHRDRRERILEFSPFSSLHAPPVVGKKRVGLITPPKRAIKIRSTKLLASRSSNLKMDVQIELQIIWMVRQQFCGLLI